MSSSVPYISRKQATRFAEGVKEGIQYFSVNKLIIWFSYGEIGFWGFRDKFLSIPQVPTPPVPYSYP